LEIVSPHINLELLSDIGERVRLLKNEGVNFVISLTFSDELADLSACEFVSILQEKLSMRTMVVGPDFAMGKRREGSFETLTRLGKELGFSVEVVPSLLIDGEVVSSTAIRNFITEGDMKKAAKFLGRPFSLMGEVVSGEGRGADLGFPTANIRMNINQVLPLEGVYAARAHINGETHSALVNIGTCPTFGEKECSVEVYLLEYQGTLYGREMRVDILERLRGEIKFSSAAELQKQVAEDIKKGKAILFSGS